MFIENEKEEKLKRDIVFDYCKVRPNCALAIIEEELGVDVAVKILDLFRGKVISIPTRDALRRSTIPINIQKNLPVVLSKDSDLFKKVVKQLSQIYKLPKRAILEMNKTGKYTR